MLLRVHALVQRLHAPVHRRRNRAAVEAMVAETLADLDGVRARRRYLRRAIADGLRTMAASWRDELRGAGVQPTRKGAGERPTRRGTTALDAVRADVLFALRHHRRRPLYAAVTVATLALAVGANTAIFSVAEAALLRALPYVAPDRIVEIRGTTQGLFRGTRGGWIPSETLTGAPGVADAAAFVPGGGVTLMDDEKAQRLTLTHATDAFFRVLGVEMLLGPGFADDERVVVLAHGLWMQSFAGDPGIIGRTIRLSGIPFVVAGVAPPEATFPGRTDVWVPYPIEWSFYSDASTFTLIARLEEDADPDGVEALLVASTANDRSSIPAAVTTEEPHLVGLRDALTEGVRAPLLVLVGAAALVFVLGCLNLAGVAISQLLRRIGELHIRTALGANRGRLSRQLLVEAMVLSALGGAAGLWTGAAGIDVLLAWLPGDVPGLTHARMDARAITLGIGLTIVAGLLIHAIPLLRGMRGERIDRAAPAGATATPHQARLRSLLAMAQVAVAVLLLIGAGLLGRSLWALSRVPLGIDTQSVLTFEAQLVTGPRRENEDYTVYGERVRALRAEYLQVVEARLSAVPGVLSVGAVSQLPLSPGLTLGTDLFRPDAPDGRSTDATVFEASARYFDAIGIPFLGGRTFSDEIGPEPEVVLSRSAAESLFGTADAAGRTVLVSHGFPQPTPARIVGVVEDIRYRGLQAAVQTAVYHSMERSFDARIGIAVRVAGDPTEVAPLIAGSLAAAIPDVPPFNLQTSRQIVSRQLAARQALAAVSALFGAVALALAVIGIYGLMAESVARRRREMGIRLALGARPAVLVARVAAAGFALALAGTLLAVPIAAGAGGLLTDVLFEVSPRDPGVLLLAPALLLAVSALAAWLPARRAARVNPVEVLSAE
jgi:predicted permease